MKAVPVEYNTGDGSEQGGAMVLERRPACLLYTSMLTKRRARGNMYFQYWCACGQGDFSEHDILSKCARLIFLSLIHIFSS